MPLIHMALAKAKADNKSYAVVCVDHQDSSRCGSANSSGRLNTGESMNDSEREQWVENDEVIGNVIEGRKHTQYLAYGG